MRLLYPTLVPGLMTWSRITADLAVTEATLETIRFTIDTRQDH
ncbi:MAG: hypothetical protein R2850_08460 [Bacteroidia bacterium]